MNKRIKELRISKGLTQSECAIDLGIARSSYAQFELGKRKLSAEEAIVLSHTFNCSIDIMLTGKPFTGIVHEVKIWPSFFKDIVSGKKTFEVRKNDRTYQVNDVLLLKEFNPDSGNYTGRTVTKTINYILYGGSFGIEEGTVVMSLT